MMLHSKGKDFLPPLGQASPIIHQNDRVLHENGTTAGASKLIPLPPLLARRADGDCTR
jgi:hypothetical protein